MAEEELATKKEGEIRGKGQGGGYGKKQQRQQNTYELWERGETERIRDRKERVEGFFPLQIYTVF
jgi:hypothetical protein